MAGAAGWQPCSRARWAAIATPRVQYTAPKNRDIVQLAAPGPGFAVATEVDPVLGDLRILEWVPAWPKFRHITAIGTNGQLLTGTATPIFATDSAFALIGAQSAAHALAAVFSSSSFQESPDDLEPVPNSELVRHAASLFTCWVHVNSLLVRNAPCDPDA